MLSESLNGHGDHNCQSPVVYEFNLLWLRVIFASCCKGVHGNWETDLSNP